MCFDGRADHTGSWFRHGVWGEREVKNDSHQTVSSSRTGNLSYLSPYLQCLKEYRIWNQERPKFKSCPTTSWLTQFSSVQSLSHVQLFATPWTTAHQAALAITNPQSPPKPMSGQVVWYSHLFQNFPQFIVIHIVKGFGIVNKEETDVFLELSCFFNNLFSISASSSISYSCKSCSIVENTAGITVQ